jgi:hypothetical protein
MKRALVIVAVTALVLGCIVTLVNQAWELCIRFNDMGLL